MRFAASCVVGISLLITALAAPLAAQVSSVPGDPIPGVHVEELEDGTIVAVDPLGARLFGSWRSYVNSQFFKDNGMKCGVRAPQVDQQNGYLSTADCTSSFTNPASQYAPSVANYKVQVVVHILQANNGNGAISDALVNSQIDVLNEDFRAIAGSLGGQGTDVNIEFELASVDPNGNPTTGINRYTKNTWYNDSGNYAAQIGWDTNRYLNIYTNTAGGNLGYAYVPNGGGVVGSSFDGVRILWTAFGRNAPIGPPYNLGRTTTHEVGHYLGLYHTFQGGCASASGCASNGDLICDTNPESSPNYSGCSRVTCGSSDPVKNYMDYSEDACMAEFTPDQARRMRCTLENWRVDLASSGGPGGGNNAPSVSISAPSNGTSVDDGTSITFSASASDAEDGNLSSQVSWSSDLDGNLGSGASVSATLSVGTHEVTAQVSDSGGLSASDTVTVTVNSVGGGGFTVSGSSYKVKGRVRVDLTWSGGVGSTVDVFRNGSLVATTANDGAYTDNTGLKGGGTLTYVLVADNGSSNTINVIY